MHFSILLAAATVFGLATSGPLGKRASKFKWFGVNESGAEFGQGNIPGVLGTDYTFPSNSSIQVVSSTCWWTFTE